MILAPSWATHQISSKYARTYLWSICQNKEFIVDWNAEGAYMSPNGMTRYSLIMFLMSLKSYLVSIFLSSYLACIQCCQKAVIAVL